MKNSIYKLSFPDFDAYEITNFFYEELNVINKNWVKEYSPISDPYAPIFRIRYRYSKKLLEQANEIAIRFSIDGIGRVRLLVISDDKSNWNVVLYDKYKNSFKDFIQDFDTIELLVNNRIKTLSSYFTLSI